MSGSSLDQIIASTESLRQVFRKDLCAGASIVVKTHNSSYFARREEDGQFTVRGGWFERKGKSPARTTIRGCTWGGSAIKVDIVAACGLRVEFGNRLLTSPVQKIFVFPPGFEN